jgi:hypothetical protein
MSGLLHECVHWLGPRSPLGPFLFSLLFAAVSLLGIAILLPVAFWLVSPLVDFLVHAIGWWWMLWLR